MGDVSVFLEPVTGWALAIFDQMAAYDGRLMFLGGLVSSFILSQAVSWVTSSALRLAIIGGVMASAAAGVVATLPKAGSHPGVQAPSMEQLVKQIPQPAQQQASGAPLRLTPPAAQPASSSPQAVRRN